MKILAIRGQNLASLKGAFELDLVAPPLGGLSLFAIAGPVGSGKSTILDALCVALFGRTPRLSGRGGAPLSDEKDAPRANDPRTLARKGAALAFAEVDFRGVDGRVWRARWQVRRARGQAFGRLLDDEQVLVDVETGQRHGTTNQEARAAIEQRLGLTFEELIRSVLLSQGGFAAFLQARPDERAALLEKITGTGIYGELSVRAFARAKEAAARIEALREERARVTVLEDAARAALIVSVQGRASRREQLEDEIGALTLVATQAEERARRVRALSRAAQRLEVALRDDEAAARARESAEQRRAALAPALERVRALDALEAALRIDDVRGAADRAAHAEAACERALVEAANARAALEQRRAESAALVEREAALVALLPRVRAVCAELDELQRARTSLEGARAVLSTFAARAAEEAAALREARTLEARALEAAQHSAARLPAALRDAPVRLALAAVARASAARASRAHEALLIELRVEERALERIGHAAARAALVDGEPCPLCGALEHPYAGDAESVTIAAQRAAVQALREQAAALRDRASASAARADELGRAGGAVPALELDDDAALTDADAALRVRERAESDVHAARERARELDVALQDAEAQHAFGVREVEALTERVEALSRSIAHALDGTGLALANDAPAAVRRALSARAQAVGAAREQLAATAPAVLASADAVRSCERACDAARVEARVARAALDDAHARQGAIVAERAALLGALSVDELVSACGPDVDAAAMRAARARAERTAAEEAHETARLEAERAAADADAPDVTEKLRAARATLTALLDEDASARAALSEDDHARARRDALDDALHSEEAASRVWAELGELIGSHDGAKFRAFAQGLTLESLIFHANTHLALLAPRYRLERLAAARVARPDLSLCVVDREAGDERRAVQSLSGGETFLVSLALALGLASLSSSRVRVESLFIDEGFSSLDPDTLEVALAAFEALRHTGRQVGVISHVPALADRIGVQVRVLPLGEGRSRVEVRAG